MRWGFDVTGILDRQYIRQLVYPPRDFSGRLCITTPPPQTNYLEAG